MASCGGNLQRRNSGRNLPVESSTKLVTKDTFLQTNQPYTLAICRKVPSCLVGHFERLYVSVLIGVVKVILPR